MGTQDNGKIIPLFPPSCAEQAAAQEQETMRDLALLRRRGDSILSSWWNRKTKRAVRHGPADGFRCLALTVLAVFVSPAGASPQRFKVKRSVHQVAG
jgi:hypothetical protein